MTATFNIINSIGKWEDYLEMELENGDATIDEIYSVFWWGGVKMTYGEWLMNCVREADEYAECEECNTWYPQLYMNYDDDTGFHTCECCMTDEEEADE
jgi:hypothetical protein